VIFKNLNSLTKHLQSSLNRLISSNFSTDIKYVSDVKSCRNSVV